MMISKLCGHMWYLQRELRALPYCDRQTYLVDLLVLHSLAMTEMSYVFAAKHGIPRNHDIDVIEEIAGIESTATLPSGFGLGPLAKSCRYGAN
jgi:hypothetical protein